MYYLGDRRNDLHTQLHFVWLVSLRAGLATGLLDRGCIEGGALRWQHNKGCHQTFNHLQPAAVIRLVIT